MEVFSVDTIKLENVTNALKGVASVLATMSEVSGGSMIWNEWALHILYEDVRECVEELESIVYEKGE